MCPPAVVCVPTPHFREVALKVRGLVSSMGADSSEHADAAVLGERVRAWVSTFTTASSPIRSWPSPAPPGINGGEWREGLRAVGGHVRTAIAPGGWLESVPRCAWKRWAPSSMARGARWRGQRNRRRAHWVCNAPKGAGMARNTRCAARTYPAVMRLGATQLVECRSCRAPRALVGHRTRAATATVTHRLNKGCENAPLTPGSIEI